MDEQKNDIDVKDQEREATQSAPLVNAAAERQAAVAEERARVREIGTMCRQFGVDDVPYINDGMSVEAVRAAILDKLAQERKAQPVTVQIDEMDKFRAAATDGLAMRAGMAVENSAPGAEEFRGKHDAPRR